MKIIIQGARITFKYPKAIDIITVDCSDDVLRMVVDHYGIQKGRVQRLLAGQWTVFLSFNLKKRMRVL